MQVPARMAGGWNVLRQASTARLDQGSPFRTNSICPQRQARYRHNFLFEGEPKSLFGG